jgi:hypothetical protein
MKSMLKITWATMVVITLVSCKKDKEDPTMNIAEPVDHTEYHWGDELHTEVLFEDDRELKSYHIHMGNLAGDHVAEFDLMYAGDISGTSYSFHEHFVVPDSIEEVYYLHFQVTDAEGKSTSGKRMLHFIP